MKNKLQELLYAIVLGMMLNFTAAGLANGAGIPKNIIIMIGDGCGYNHVVATNYYQTGEAGAQVYEKFPVTLGMSTYSASGDGYDPTKAWTDFSYVTHRPTDSAAAATAMSTGVKTNNGAIGVDEKKHRLEHLVEHLEKFGKSSGVVTTVMFSHATPAGFIAHQERRDQYSDIAREMILDSPLEVIMGCGHPHYDDNGRLLEQAKFDYTYVGGDDVWQALKQGRVESDSDTDGVKDTWHLIETRQEFLALGSGDTPKRVIGVPRVRMTLQHERAGNKKTEPFVDPLVQDVPTLPEMTAAALNILDNDADGFFLLIEGGAIDWAGHENNSGRMIEETIDFNKAVDAVVAWINESSSWDQTLLVVTADHETGYLTGPGSGEQDKMGDSAVKPIWNPIVNNGQGKLPGLEWHITKHTNSLVPFYSKGAGCELFLKYADETDAVCGAYLNNIEIAQAIFALFPTAQ
ncbi:MAG: alkaline phosphatase [Candidatus Zhuqueibacterota bacterium]